MADVSSDIIRAFIGGGMIGFAAVLLMGAYGRVMGISGIISGLLPLEGRSVAEDRVWRILFLIGLLFAPLLYVVLSGEAPTVSFKSGPVLLGLGGFIVGVGTVLGSGCTSGHGVCGLARLSTRSVVATFTFMMVAGVTVYVMRHLVEG